MYGVKPFRVCVLIEDENIRGHIERKIKEWLDERCGECTIIVNNSTTRMISLNDISFEIYHYPEFVTFRGLKNDLYICDSLFEHHMGIDGFMEMFYAGGLSLTYHKKSFRRTFKSIELRINDYNALWSEYWSECNELKKN